MKDILAAARYAEALFQIARLLHQDEEIEAELEAFSEALKKSPELQKSLGNPQLGLSQKRKFLQRIYQERRHEIYGVLLNFFALLFQKNRFHLIHEIAVQFKRIADEAQGQAVAELNSAAPLSAKAEAALVSRLEKIAGYRIEVKKTVDPSLVGGVRVRVKNKVIDGSIQHRIGQLKKELLSARGI